MDQTTLDDYLNDQEPAEHQKEEENPVLNPEPRCHELKIWPEFFKPVAEGAKTFEYRHDDRGFMPGDKVVLREWCPYSKVYSGLSLQFTIGFIYYIENTRFVIFSLLRGDSSEEM